MYNAILNSPVGQALEQPQWEDVTQVQRVREYLSACPALVDADDVWRLRSLLARVAAGEAIVVQAGDCAEDPAQSTPDHVARKAALLDVLAGVVKLNTHMPVIRVGRIAGQFSKPRSRPTERLGHLELPVFRGHMVNAPEPDPFSRRPDPWRLVSCYHAAQDVVESLGWRGPSWRRHVDPPMWISHEALLLDYEIPMLRHDGEGRQLLGSTHWPWIGDRTRQVDGAHVALLSRVINPLACKVGPTMTVSELCALCERLDPEREPGRLTLIARIGAGKVAELLPPLVSAVRGAGHPAIWLCDPMHANTVRTPNGLKTRFLNMIMREQHDFQEAVGSAGGIVGGLHLEVTPDDITECVPDESCVDEVGDNYTTFCDPRLNRNQAVTVVSAWRRRQSKGTRQTCSPDDPTKGRGMMENTSRIEPYRIPAADDLPDNIAQSAESA
ncbi:MAG: 3-deoxy-7-phosphoheptulonate synthase [Trebonia sp.]